MMKRARRILEFLVCAAGLFYAGAGAAVADAGPWTRTDAVEARLVSAVSATGELASIPLGVQVRLRPGWKTYWRSPGDAGLAPQIDWSASENLAAAEIAWPAPHRFTLFGIETFGYEREVVFPVTARPQRPGEPVSLAGRLEILVCSDICVPNTLQLSLALPSGAAGAAPEGNLINRYAAQVPGDGRAAGLTVESAAATVFDGNPALSISARAREPFVSPDIFVETVPPLSFGAPRLRFVEDDRSVTLTLPLSGKLPDGVQIAGLPATLTLVDGARSVEAAATIGAAPAAPAGTSVSALLPILGIALLGGLLLNLMPCVLPVLSLKLLSVVGHGGASPAVVRAGFLASAAGILFSFALLAGVLIGLKAAGAAVGWGIQFQQPLFLVLMIVVLTLFATNLWGFLEIPLPRFVAHLGGSGRSNGPLAGHFLTGVLATLLATPCSAPFLGTAVGFALARGPAEIAAVFTALGLGLAFPYLLVAAFPRLAAALPRPGRWMIGLRRVLGVALAVTAGWLVSVLVAQEGASIGAAVGLLALALAGVIAGRRALPSNLRPASGFVAVALALAAFAMPLHDRPAAEELPSPAGAARWTAFDEAAIRQLVAGGRTVLVDVTADWCITCKANKLLVLDRGPVAERLGGEVVGMRADWTRPDESIARYLAGFGRYGIPFNVVYGPGAPNGLALSELLTEGAVMAALDRASGRS